MNENDIKNTDTEDTTGTAEETAASTTAPEMSELDKVRAERDEYLSGWQRAKADFANAKKRADESLVEYRKLATEGLVEELIPVLQSFEMAFANKESWEKADKNWRAGVEYIHGQLKSVLEQNGLKEVNPLGEEFNPNRDEAIEFVPVDDVAQSNKIVGVVSKGYSLNGKDIRAPKVKVGETKEA
jgi:molecular chaperone GrpE